MQRFTWTRLLAAELKWITFQGELYALIILIMRYLRQVIEWLKHVTIVTFFFLWSNTSHGFCNKIIKLPLVFASKFSQFKINPFLLFLYPSLLMGKFPLLVLFPGRGPSLLQCYLFYYSPAELSSWMHNLGLQV